MNLTHDKNKPPHPTTQSISSTTNGVFLQAIAKEQIKVVGKFTQALTDKLLDDYQISKEGIPDDIWIPFRNDVQKNLLSPSGKLVKKLKDLI